MVALSSAVARRRDFRVPILGIACARRGDVLALTLGDGSARLMPATADDEAIETLAAHDGVSLSLCADADDHAFLSGGDDGKALLLEPGVGVPTLVAERKGAWIDHVASFPDGQRVWTSGREIHRCGEDGKETQPPFVCPGTPGGVAFSPNGKRLAAAHANGVTLWWTRAKGESEPQRLAWKGAHAQVLWHPDGKSLVTTMQENALHGWRLADGADMAMQGYMAKVEDAAFTAGGRYLVTAGADQVIGWPFFGGGPWNKTPLTLGGRDGRLVKRVAPHPSEPVVAAGYEDGMVILAPLDGRLELLLQPPVAVRGAGVIGLVWNGAGDALFAALENGELLAFTRASISRAARGG